ncbi:MAG TPA: DUF2948 family protein [Alphaproteobacteria bacterium]
MAETLHLRAEDAEDLAVISSCLQDALVPLLDMRFDRAARRFILAANRFRWEGCEPCIEAAALGPDAVFERIACAVTFEDVSKVSVQGIDQAKRDTPLELLAMVTGEAGGPGPSAIVPTSALTIRLIFAGGGVIRLEADGIRCRLEDFGEPWPTQWRPRHRLDAESA